MHKCILIFFLLAAPGGVLAQNQLRLGGFFANNIEVDSTLRFLSRLPSPVVPRYTELDGHFGGNSIPKVELSIIGRNLLDRQHPEFGPPGPFREEVQRNVYGRVAFRF